MTGPIVIIGRPRSGSRLACRLLLDNGVFMGADLHAASLDSRSWAQYFTVPLITSRFFPFDDPTEPTLGQVCATLLKRTFQHYWGGKARSGAWGWKYCESLFAVPVIKYLFPDARFIHIIRDGRDVCLSHRGFFQLTQDRPPTDWTPHHIGHQPPSFFDFCVTATFGRQGVRSWQGLDLTMPYRLVDHRYLIQAVSWATCVDQAQRHGAAYPDDYFELRYEELCNNPQPVARALFRWLGMPLRQFPPIFNRSVGKWRQANLSPKERRDFARACEFADPLLKRLHYA